VFDRYKIGSGTDLHEAALPLRTMTHEHDDATHGHGEHTRRAR
jgi:hypothetical protein